MYYDQEKAALFVIDMQNAGLHENGHLYEEETSKKFMGIVPNIQKIIRRARECHIPVVFIRHAYLPGYKDGGILVHELFPSDIEANGWIDGTFDTEIIEELKPEADDIIIKKNRYSAFYQTPLDMTLRNMGINTIIISGLYSNCCCESTARDAVYRDYRLYFMSDATAAIEDDLHEATLRTISTFFGKVLTTDEMIGRMGV